jgi:aspartokinase-like uncharacterized kinase
VGLFALVSVITHTGVMSSASDSFASPFGLHSPTATIKLGGSLLDLTDLADRLEQLRPDWGNRPMVVVGGGPAADLVRDWDLRHQLGEARSHWLALDALELTSRLLVHLWPIAQLASVSELDACWQAGCVPVIRAREWFELAADNSQSSPPQNWQTTTDTIAAWIASVSHSASLWLLKSVDPPASLTDAVQRALVDPTFTSWLPPNVSLQWVNLRASPDQPEL